MITIKKLIYNVQSKQESIKTSAEISLKIHDNNKQNMYIIHKILKTQLIEQRQWSANTKTRSEVQGGGKKPWKQKGSGRARAGSIRSPLWKGGGIIFGPRTKTYKSKVNKKEKSLALKALLYNKYPKTIVIEDFAKNLNKPKTKLIINELEQLGIAKAIYSNTTALIIVSKVTNHLYLSIRNIPNINLISAYNLNLLSIIKAKTVIITSSALEIIHHKYSSSNDNNKP